MISAVLFRGYMYMGFFRVLMGKLFIYVVGFWVVKSEFFGMR